MTLLKYLVLGLGLVGFTLAPAWAELKTTGSAIGCLTPDKLQAAEEAAKRHDRMQMDMLGCFPISTGTVARRIEDGTAAALWHVVLDPNGPQPMEVWARPTSFQGD
jgi:hypothetical protein